MSFVFLKAKWQNLIMANYIVKRDLLQKYLPKYTELDFYKGNSYISLVGFLFKDTQILGMKFPFHKNFEEVNLRFYVKYNDNGEWKRGVVFIKEIVPKFAIAFVANKFYHERYETMEMQHFIKQSKELLCVGYYWKYKKAWNKIGVIAEEKPLQMLPGSEEDFIAQHYWGYSKYNDEVTFEYEVKHPSWNVYPIKKFDIKCDFAGLYGKEFSFLKDENPSSVFLADGSEVTILQKKNAMPSGVK